MEVQQLKIIHSGEMQFGGIHIWKCNLFLPKTELLTSADANLIHWLFLFILQPTKVQSHSAEHSLDLFKLKSIKTY